MYVVFERGVREYFSLKCSSLTSNGLFCYEKYSTSTHNKTTKIIRTQVQWPISWLNLLRPLRIFDFDVFSLPYMSCMVNASYWGHFFTQMLLPLFVISCFFLAVPILKLCSSRKSYDYDAALRYGLLAIVMIYPQNTRLIIESLNCVTISDGTSYLAADFSIECSSSSYSSMVYSVYVSKNITRITHSS